MSQLPDGREVLCTLALPLPLQLATALGRAIDEAAKRAGYLDPVLLTDGTNRIVATKRPPAGNPAHEPHCDGSCTKYPPRRRCPDPSKTP